MSGFESVEGNWSQEVKNLIWNGEASISITKKIY